MESRAHALAAGLFTLVMSLAVIASLWWLSDRTVATRDYVLVTSGNLTGLNPQGQVRYRGIRCGKVVDIGLDPRDRRNLLVTIRIEADIPITRSTRAQLGFQGVTGLAYVQLTDSGESVEPLAQTGGEPPRIELASSPLEMIGDQAAEMLGEARVALGRLTKLLDDRNLERIGRTLDNLETATAAVNGTLREMPALVATLRKDAPEVTAGLKQLVSEPNARRVQTILANVEKTSGEAGTLAADVRTLVASLQALAAKVDGLSTEAGGEVVANTLPRMGQLLQELNSNSRQLRRLLEQLEHSPQSILFGPARGRPGPGESGFEGFPR